jgi:hypothetical protein
MYAEPGPTVELVVPAGYHGLVKAELRIQDDAPVRPGQRCFCYPVPLDGVVTAIGPRLLRRVGPADYRFRYADGLPLTPNAKGSEIGFWWLKTDGWSQCFVIGTEHEYDAYRRDEAAKEAGIRTGAGGQGGSHGRHGRRGNPSSDQS